MAESRLALIVETKGGGKLKRLKTDADGTEQKLRKLNGELPKTAKGIRNTGKAAATATANVQRFGVAFRSTLGPLVSVFGAVQVLGRSLKVFGDRQADVAVLENGLKKLGATEQDLNKLLKTADEFGKATLFNEEDFVQGAALLTSFGNIAQEEYSKVIDLAGDLATVNKGALKDSLLQLSKALNDPAQNLSALGRSGIQFTEAQKKLIKSLQESGKLAEAQALVFKEIQAQYGGAARAAGSAGLAGALDTLGEEWRDLLEQLGEATNRIFTPLVKGLTQLLAAFNKLDGPTKQFIATFALVSAGALAAKLAFAGLTAAVGALNAAVLANPWVLAAAGLVALGVAAFNATSSMRLLNDAVNGNLDGVEDLQGAKKRLQDQLVKTEQQIAKGGRSAIVAKEKFDKLKKAIDNIDREILIRVRIQEIREKFGIDPNAAPGTRGRQGRIDELKRKKEQERLDKLAAGSGSGSKAKKERESQLPALTRELTLKKELFAIDEQIRAAELPGNKELADKLQKDRILVELNGEIQKIKMEQIPLDEQLEKIAIARLDADEKLAVLAQRQQLAAQQLAESRAAALRPIEDEIALLQASLNGDEARVQREIDIRNLANERLGITREQAAALIDQKNRLTELKGEAEKLNEIYAQVGARIKDGLVDSITAAIDGSKDLQQIWSDILKDIGKLLIRQGIGMIGGSGGLGLPGFADGGIAPAGKPALVGERGPEIIRPLTPTAVIPNNSFAEAAAALSSGPVAMSEGDSLDDQPGSTAYSENARAIEAINNAYSQNSSAIANSSSTYLSNMQAANMERAASGGSMNVAVDTTVINNQEYVTVAQFSEGLNKTAKQARARVFSDLKNKPSARAGVGL